MYSNFVAAFSAQTQKIKIHPILSIQTFFETCEEDDFTRQDSA